MDCRSSCRCCFAPVIAFALTFPKRLFLEYVCYQWCLFCGIRPAERMLYSAIKRMLCTLYRTVAQKCHTGPCGSNPLPKTLERYGYLVLHAESGIGGRSAPPLNCCRLSLPNLDCDTQMVCTLPSCSANGFACL